VPFRLGLKDTLIHAADVGARAATGPLGARDGTVGVARAEDRFDTLRRIRARRLRRIRAHVDERPSGRKVGRLHAALGLSILAQTVLAGTLVRLSGKRCKGIRDQVIDDAASTRRLQRSAGAVELLGVTAGIKPRALAGLGRRIARHSDAQRIVGEAIAVGVVQSTRVAGIGPGPGRIIPLPGKDGTGTSGVYVQAELGQILLPNRVVRPSRVDPTAWIRRRAVTAYAGSSLTGV